MTKRNNRYIELFDKKYLKKAPLDGGTSSEAVKNY
jgi:hypothetical protein